MLNAIIISASVVAAVLAVGFILNFRRSVQQKHGHLFFAMPRLIVGSLAGAAIVVGAMGFNEGSGLIRTVAPYAVLAGIGIMTLLVGFNIHRTGLVVGSVGSVLEVALFLASGFIGLAALIPVSMIAAANVFGRAEPRMYPGHPHYDHLQQDPY